MSALRELRVTPREFFGRFGWRSLQALFYYKDLYFCPYLCTVEPKNKRSAVLCDLLG